MKYLKKFENYTSETPLSFDSVFKITKEQLNDYLSDMIDTFDYIDFDVISDDYKTFNIEFHTDSDENLDSEFDFYKKEASENIKNQLKLAHSLDVVSEEYDKERNRIILTVKPI